MASAEMAKPMLLTSVSTLLADPRGALVAVSALNCGEWQRAPEEHAPNWEAVGLGQHGKHQGARNEPACCVAVSVLTAAPLADVRRMKSPAVPGAGNGG